MSPQNWHADCHRQPTSYGQFHKAWEVINHINYFLHNNGRTFNIDDEFLKSMTLHQSRESRLSTDMQIDPVHCEYWGMNLKV